MSDTPAENTTADAAAAQPTLPVMRVLSQFTRDLSFENLAAQKQLKTDSQPAIQYHVGVNARKRSAEHQYDVSLQVKVDAKTTDEEPQPIFLIELDYAGIFHVENVEETHLHAFLHIECPRMLFPFVRRIVSDVTRDGGFPPLNLDSIDFVQVYRNQLAQAAQQNKEHADA